MKENGCGKCPGCKRHCAADNPRCKFGRKYFCQNENAEKKHKWEKNVVHGSLAWRLLMVSHRIKKALRHKKITEDKLTALLSHSERQALQEILEKLEHCCKNFN